MFLPYWLFCWRTILSSSGSNGLPNASSQVCVHSVSSCMCFDVYSLQIPNLFFSTYLCCQMWRAPWHPFGFVISSVARGFAQFWWKHLGLGNLVFLIDESRGFPNTFQICWGVSGHSKFANGIVRFHRVCRLCSIWRFRFTPQSCWTRVSMQEVPIFVDVAFCRFPYIIPNVVCCFGGLFFCCWRFVWIEVHQSRNIGAILGIHHQEVLVMLCGFEEFFSHFVTREYSLRICAINCRLVQSPFGVNRWFCL